MADLGNRTRTGKTDINNPVLSGGWTVTFDPAYVGIQVEYEVYHIALKGPAGSSFEVWTDSTFYDTHENGQKNSWDPAQPLHANPGQTIYFYFDSSAGVPPTVSIFCREVSPV